MTRSAKNKKTGVPSNTTQIRSTGGRGHGRGMRRHEGPYGHLHAGPPLENKGGARCERAAGRRAARVVSGAGEDFGRGGRGEQFGRGCRMRGLTGGRTVASRRAPRPWRGRVGPGADLGRPEADELRWAAISVLGNGLWGANHHEDALSVRMAHVSLVQRHGTDPANVLALQNNLAVTYDALGRHENAARMLRDVYSGHLKLHGDEYPRTLGAANNYASSLSQLNQFEEAKALVRKTLPSARRVLGEHHETTLMMRSIYGEAHKAGAATPDDHRQ